VATPTTSGPVSSVPLSGNVFIDSLLGGTKWGGSVGTGTTVTFSFPQGGSSYWSTDPVNGYGSSSGGGEPWNSFGLISVQQSAFQSALQKWANVANISFSKSADNQTTAGDIRVSFTYNANSSEAAHAYFPSYGPKGGDIWLNANGYFTTYSNLNFGSYGFFTILHELGHALGLKHPFETLSWNSNTLPEQYDAWHYTVMSYEGVPGSPLVVWTYQPTTPMRFDIEALQYLYGPNLQFHAGDDVYTYYAGQNYFETIWDAGGSDTIQYIAASDPSEIDLRPGALSNLGNTLYTQDFSYSSIYTVVIYDTVVIENAIGGDGPDLIYGNNVANSLEGHGGADTILGGLGDDSIEGGDGNDRLEGGPGNDRFDWESSTRAGADTLAGGSGDDEYVIFGNDQVIENSSEGIDTIFAFTNYSIQFVANVEALVLSGTDSISGTGNALDNILKGTSGSNVLDGKSGRDTMYGGEGNDRLNGGVGLDRADFIGNRSAYTITKTISDYTVSGPQGTDTLSTIERLKFSDKSLAIDMTVSEAGGKTALLLGACLGASGLNDKATVGAILDYFDGGYTLTDAATVLVDAGIVAQLAGGADNKHFVDWMFLNLVDALPDAATEAVLIDFITSGQFTQATFLATVAALQINQDHIGLVGLQQNGMEFV